MCLTLVLVCLAVVLTSVGQSAVERQDPSKINAETEAEEDWGGESSVDEVVPSDDFEKSEEGKEQAQESQTQKAPNFSNGVQALAYALSQLEQNSYSIKYSQTVVGESIGVKGTQRINREIYNENGVSYIKAVADGSEIPMGLGETYTEFYYIDSSNVVKNRDGKILTETKSAYVSKYGILLSEIPYNLNAVSSKNITFNKNIKASYYTITINLPQCAWGNYLKYIGAVGGEGCNPQMESIKLTIKIDKEYGVIKQINADEKYTIQRGGLSANTTSTVQMKFSYNKDNSTQIGEIKENFN